MAFDKHQIKALLKEDDVHVILAGAGSGKTTTMIGRMLRAQNHKAIMNQLPLGVPFESIDGDKIRAVSFTNVAANTLKSRLAEFGDKDVDQIEVSTMDNFCIQIIRHIYPNALVTLDESEISKVLYHDMPEIGLKGLFEKYSDYYSVIYEGSRRYAKATHVVNKKMYYDENLDKYVEHIISKAKDRNEELNIPLAVVYRFAVTLMVKHRFVPDIELLILDEFQDTADSQFLVVNFLLSQVKGLKFVGIGDISQSMYRWNNAKPQRVSQFIDEYDAGISTLPNNYRSHPKIIEFANEMLKFNLDNISGIQLKAATKAQHNPAIDDDNRIKHLPVEEVFSDITSKIVSGVPAKDIAVITRTNTNIKRLKEELNGMTTKKFDFDTSHFDKNNRVQWLQTNIRMVSSAITKFADIESNNSGDMKTTLKAVLEELEKFYIIDDKNPIFTYYADAISRDPANGQIQFINYLNTRLNRMKEKLDRLLWTATPRDESSIFLSTVHGIKGEEFKYVYYLPAITNIEKRAKVDDDMPKEEREYLWGNYAETQNIHYVAITRAIEQFIILSHADENIEKRSKINKRKAQDKEYNDDMDVLLSHLNQPKYHAKQYDSDGELIEVGAQTSP